MPLPSKCSTSEKHFHWKGSLVAVAHLVWEASPRANATEKLQRKGPVRTFLRTAEEVVEDCGILYSKGWRNVWRRDTAFDFEYDSRLFLKPNLDCPTYHVGAGPASVWNPEGMDRNGRKTKTHNLHGMSGIHQYDPWKLTVCQKHLYPYQQWVKASLPPCFGSLSPISSANTQSLLALSIPCYRQWRAPTLPPLLSSHTQEPTILNCFGQF